MKKIFILIMTGLSLLTNQAQTTFQYYIGGSDDDAFIAADQNPDGTLVVGGYFKSLGAGQKDFYVSKLAENGSIIHWARTFGGANDDVCRAVQSTMDGNILAVGTTASFGHGGKDAVIIKLDQIGNPMWARVIGGTANEEIWALYENDWYYYVVGNTLSYGSTYDILLICLYKNGDVHWTKTYNSGANEGGNAICEGLNNTIAISGAMFPTGQPHDITTFKIDTAGNVIWSNKYMHQDEGAFAIVPAVNGGYITAGLNEAGGIGVEEAFAICISETGTFKWAKIYGGSSYQNAAHIIRSLDDKYLLHCYTNSFGFGDDDLMLLKIDTLGNLVWARNYGSIHADGEVMFHVPNPAMLITNDQGILITSSVTGPSATDLNAYIVKTDASGISGCHEGTISPSQQALTFTTLNYTLTPTIRYIDDTLSFPNTTKLMDIIQLCLTVGDGQGEIPIASGIRILQVPNDGDLIIKSETNYPNATVSIYNALGQCLLSRTISVDASGTRLETLNLSKGVYFLRLSDSGRLLYSGKIIIN